MCRLKDDDKGFLLIRQTYRVRCQQCGWKGEAKLGSEPILTEEVDGAEYCPVCGHLALVGDEQK
jgi:DNA-directed RNA polymerase subunit RPC12/RpoP